MFNWYKNLDDERKSIFKQGLCFAGYVLFMVFVYAPLKLLAGLLELQD